MPPLAPPSPPTPPRSFAGVWLQMRVAREGDANTGCPEATPPWHGSIVEGPAAKPLLHKCAARPCPAAALSSRSWSNGWRDACAGVTGMLPETGIRGGDGAEQGREAPSQPLGPEGPCSSGGADQPRTVPGRDRAAPAWICPTPRRGPASRGTPVRRGARGYGAGRRRGRGGGETPWPRGPRSRGEARGSGHV